MPSNRKIYWALGILLVLSAVIRALIAGSIELGNDEVYYWTYAKFPDMSHFDHPPMVGLVIQLFTLNLRFDSELFLRLGSVVLGTASTWMIFLIGKKIKNAAAGLYAAFLFTASFYGFILVGTFILPDTPQVFFWLVSMYLLLCSLPDESLSNQSRAYLFFSGLSIGLALLSKYHSVFLIFGAGMFILFHNRKWLLAKETWIALLIAVMLFMPVIFWNSNNNYISFTFHESRVGVTDSGIQPQYFLTEMAGQVFYNNPVNIILIILAFVALLRGKEILEKSYRRLILWMSLPLWLVFVSFSLFRSTLPHWTGPAYIGFILIAASWLATPSSKEKRLKLIPWPAAIALVFILAVISLAVTQIRYGWVPLKKWKVEDVSADLWGMQQLGEKFAPMANWEEEHFLIDKGSPIFTFRWFPAANFDYYVARPSGRKVYALGSLERIHKYQWINRTRGGMKKDDDAWYIALSDDYEDPVSLYGKLFELVLPSDTISIIRGHDTIRKAYIYKLINLKEDLSFMPKDSLKHAVKTDTLAYFIVQIRNNPDWMEILQKRARDKGIPLTEMVKQEAKKMIVDHKDMMDLKSNQKKDSVKQIRILKDDGR
ncbi:MAG: glycosyltransferase family 39 protein [Bacteroidetes bacterium]|nr:glycosyltransferase family 39 protein [Bacteroidota bacterium]